MTPNTNRLPRHKFWGAGEPDCPQDLKAPNGELHTIRCKVCGYGWRKSTDVCLAAIPVVPPLSEARITERAHRMVTRFKMLDPEHGGTTYLFTNDTLIEFARALLQAQGLNGSPGSESTRPDQPKLPESGGIGVSSIGLGAEGEQ